MEPTSARLRIDIRISQRGGSCFNLQQVPLHEILNKTKFYDFGESVFATLSITTFLVCICHIFIDRARDQRYQLMDRTTRKVSDYKYAQLENDNELLLDDEELAFD